MNAKEANELSSKVRDNRDKHLTMLLNDAFRVIKAATDLGEFECTLRRSSIQECLPLISVAEARKLRTKVVKELCLLGYVVDSDDSRILVKWSDVGQETAGPQCATS